MEAEDRIIHLLHKEKPRPDREECIEILENVLNAFKEDLKFASEGKGEAK